MSGCQRFLGERRSEHIYGKWEGIRGRGVVAEARSCKARGGCVFRNKGGVEKGRDVSGWGWNKVRLPVGRLKS